MALAATALSMTRADSRKRIAIPVASVVAWTAYVVVIGGDISPARRHLVVTIVLLSLVVSEGLRALDTRAVWLRVAAGALAAVGLFTLARDQREDPEKAHAIHDTWVWSGRDVGRFLSRAFAAERPLVAVDAAGTLPYYAPELPCLDMLGLNDRAIATLHPPDFGKGYLGHELGNGAYILSRRPDLIVFHNSLGDEVATWRGGRELEDSDEFARLYQLVTFETPEGARTRLWVRKEDGRIGVKRTDLEVAIPGYLFHTSRGGVARLDPQGRVGLQVDGSHPASMLVAGLAPGRWRARVDESGALDVTVVGQGEQTKGSAGTDLFFAQRSEAPVTLLVTLREGDRAHLRGVVLQRVQD
jgi:hypothetical protein